MASNKYQTDVQKDVEKIAVLHEVASAPPMVPANPVSVKLGEWTPAEPSPIFNALLAGDVANRGISWYAQPANSTNLLSRVRLLMLAEQAILEVYRAQNS